MRVKDWIKENQGKYFCHCPCHGEIIIKTHHKYYGIPKYIMNHNWVGTHRTEEWKQNHSKRMQGENHPFYGKHHTEENKQKNRQAHSGNNNWNWQGGKSFEPYCEKFNEKKKEEIRNQYGRKCYVCDKLESEQKKEQKERGKRQFRLSVHHIDFDKEQGCNGKQWKLVPLCLQCHNKIKLEVKACE